MFLGSQLLPRFPLLAILLICILFGITLGRGIGPDRGTPRTGGSSCSFSIWKQRELTAKGVFGKHFGKLAELYNVSTIEDCTRHCLYVRYCYMAQFEGTSYAGYCNLYYYNFPPLYRYEVESPVRIVDAGENDGKAIIFNLTHCDEKVSYKHPCTFASHEEMTPERTSTAIRPFRNTTALNAEQCALACSGTGEQCTAAVFSHRRVAIDDVVIHSSCEMFADEPAALAAAKEYKSSNRTPVLLTEIKCYRDVSDESCQFTFADRVIKTVSAGFPPDSYYGAKSPAECASVCGHSPFCIEAEFQPNDRRKECLLYRDYHLKKVKYTEPKETKSPYYKVRMKDIDCSASRRIIVG